MNEQKKLTIQMAFFFLIVFVTFGAIVVKEKSTTLFMPKIENSITEYIKTNYKELELTESTITEKNKKYTMKVTNPNNKNHYFYINYSNKNISDTYKKDYLEGQSILNYLIEKTEKEIYELTNKSYKIKFINTLNAYSERVQEKIINEHFTNLKIYIVEKEIATNWDIKQITDEITTAIKTIEKINYTPKSYTITITNKNDISQSIEINNLTSEITKNNTLKTIISDIINNKESNVIKENNITYKYLN